MPDFLPRSARRYALTLFLALLWATFLSACSTSNISTSSLPPSGVVRYVGPVQNTTAWIGIVADQPAGKMAAYVCDSKAIGEWFTGKLNADGSFDVTNDSSAHLTGKLTPKQVQGTFSQPDGPPMSYSAQPAVDKQGIYRVNQTINGVLYTGGWVLGPNGTIEGNVRHDHIRKLEDVSGVDPTQGTVKLPDGTNITPEFINQDVQF